MIGRLVDLWARVCLGYRKTVLVMLAAVTALTASALPHVRFDNALEIWFLEDDPSLADHRDLVDTFGSDELIIVGIEAPDVFAPSVLEVVDRLSREIETAPHVEKVFSLTTIEAIVGRDDLLEVGPLVEMPATPAELAEARRRALTSKLYVGNIVSAAGDFTAIIARLPHRTDDFDYKLEAVAAVRAMLEAESARSGMEFILSGGPPLDEQFFVNSEKDSLRTIRWVVVLLGVFLWLTFRSAVGVWLPLFSVGIATTWAIGWMVLCNVRVNVITTMLPPLLLATGVAGTIHFLVDYQRRSAGGLDRMEALRATYRELTVPLFLTSLTTSIGMLSLCISRVRGIREFGVFAALGVMGAFFLAVTLVPIVLSYLRAPRIRERSSLASAVLSGRTLQRLCAFTVRHARAIVIVSSALVVLGALGAMQVRAESVFLELFKDDEPIKIATRKIEENLSGAYTLDIVIDTKRPDGIKDPELLRKVEALEAFLESDPEVSATQSIASYFKEMRRAFFANDPREYKLPATREEAAQYLLLYEMDAPDGDIKEFATFDYRRTRVTARVNITSSNAATALVKRTEAWLTANLPDDVDAKVTGIALLYAAMEEYIRTSLVRGFSLALVAIFLVFCIQMGSVALGAVAMIPNVVPIVMALGIMGACGIRLDSTTAMVASVAIGLAVDDTIHFVSRVRLYLARGRTMSEALEMAIVEVGRAMIYTSIVLCAGFGVMLTSSFVGITYFGLLCAITIVFALAADLLLLPVVLRWCDRRAEALPTVAADVGDALQAER